LTHEVKMVLDEKEVEITIDGFTGKVLAVLVEPADNHDD